MVGYREGWMRILENKLKWKSPKASFTQLREGGEGARDGEREKW